MKEDNYREPLDAFVAAIDVHELLPQQEPFVMIDRLTHFDMRRVTTATVVRDECLFVENGVMNAFGLTENIAQTCAARIGYINKYILDKGIQVGFIGAIRNLTVECLPKVGDRLDTEVEIEEEVFGMLLAKATVRSGGKTLVTAVMKIAIKSD